MYVVWCLGGTPERQFVIGVEIADSGVLLQRQVSVPFIEEDVLANQISFGESLFDVAEFERNFLVNVSLVAIVVNAGVFNQNRFFNS